MKELERQIKLLKALHEAGFRPSDLARIITPDHLDLFDRLSSDYGDSFTMIIKVMGAMKHGMICYENEEGRFDIGYTYDALVELFEPYK